MNKPTVKLDLRDEIYQVRGVPVMLDSDLSKIYGVETKVFNQAVSRNIERFPEQFRFQLTKSEYEDLRSHFVTSSFHGGRRYLPFAFTEQGVAMLSAVLKSQAAVQISIQVINAFVEMRRFLISQEGFVKRVQQLEYRQIALEEKVEGKFEAIFSALEEKTPVQKQGVFYDGQIFDAYLFVSKLIRSAKKSIVILDNYVDETVFEHLSKCSHQIDVYIFTRDITSNLKLDLKKYEGQYQQRIKLIKFSLSHDRFLIIDHEEVYHIGASLKDLGRKWCAFSKLEPSSFGLMDKIKQVISAS